jgi:D-cysteine desulfhydrase
MELPELPLFRAFPAARERLAWRRFVGTPTPVSALPVDALHGGVLHVKHDERSCPSYGGNKPRKLEFVIGHALSRGARRLVTTGGLGTNHGLATTILGREAGLATTLVLVRQPVTEEVRRTLLLHASYGAEHVFGASIAACAAHVLRVLVRSAARGERPYLVPTGGSSARGDLGFVSAAFELAEQVRAGLLPEPRELFVAVGSGGTLAGLVLGLRLAGLRTRATGVLVTDILPPSPARLLGAARRTLRLLRRADPSVPEIALERDDFPLLRDQLGAGYGAPTPEAEAAVRYAAERGLRLDTTYTGKCLAALRARAARGTLREGPVLFWNTFNAVDVASRAPRRASEADLPGPIRRLLGASASSAASRRAGAPGPAPGPPAGV